MKNQILNRFIGVIDNRDEYQTQEIYKELAFSGMLLWGLTMLLMSISLVIDTIKNEVSFITLALLIVNLVYAALLMVRLNRKQLDNSDCATIEEYNAKKNRLKRACTIAGIQWGLFMVILMEYIFPFLSKEAIQLSWINILIWFAGGLFFGIIMYAISKAKLKKYF